MFFQFNFMKNAQSKNKLKIICLTKNIVIILTKKLVRKQIIKL